MVMEVPVEEWNTLVFNSKLFHFLWKHGLAARSAWGKLVGAFGNIESAWWSPSDWKDRSFPTELAEKKMGEMGVTQRLGTVPAEAIGSWVNGNSACALEPLAPFGEKWPELWVSPGCSTLMTHHSRHILWESELQSWFNILFIWMSPTLQESVQTPLPL